MEATIEKLKHLARDSWSGPTGEQRAVELERFLREMLAEYSAALGFPEAEILTALEAKRTYSAINYYQRANFPTLDGVRVFETVLDVGAAMPSWRFRCPRCGGISTDPCVCDSGQEMEKGKVCNWCTGGFFRDLGKGVRIVVRSQFLEAPRVHVFFMPVEWERSQVVSE